MICVLIFVIYVMYSLSEVCQTFRVSVIIFCCKQDECVYGLSGILSVCRDGKELPVAFYSRQLRGAERRYAATELEGLGVICSVKHFEVYLHEVNVVVETDRKVLEYLMSSKHLSAKLTRWALYLQQFTMSIRYRLGHCNKIVDGLSRQGWSEKNDGRHLEGEGRCQGIA